MKLFLETKPLKFLAMYLLGPIKQTPQPNIFILAMADRFSQVTMSIPLRKTTASAVTAVLWSMEHGASRYVLADNNKKFASKFSDFVRETSFSRNYRTTAYFSASKLVNPAI